MGQRLMVFMVTVNSNSCTFAKYLSQFWVSNVLNCIAAAKGSADRIRTRLTRAPVIDLENRVARFSAKVRPLKHCSMAKDAMKHRIT